MSAVGCSLAVREGSLVTDRPVTMAYLSSGRTFDLEGITEMAGPALNLMVTKLNPRADKSARALLAESNARFRGDFGRDHTLQFHWDEIFDDPSSSSSSSSEKNHESGEGAGEGGGKALSLNDLAALQVSIAFQSLPVMGTGPSGGSNGSGSGYKYNVHRSWESMSTISPLGLEIFPAGGDPVQYAAQSLEKKSGGEETTWMVRTSYDSSVVSLEEATTFIDDSFVHLKRMLTRPEERLDGLVVTEPGVYTSTNGKDGKEERWDFVPANERKVHLFPLRPAAPLSAFFRLWMTFFTIMMFNLRLAFRGKPKEGGAKIKTN
ncbi:hypothetical protein BOTBODRAFT_32436 [Botryobasidium botryosum FD-172 SS1]|uniref:Condensation domain-containing protein n=1 Tax=Botryobasidium botryosum (strain FD-172 SS1) TaxID=930990 RepID=A0A067MIX3_BOTB1|nr:hypothetical protein BOTBODRAFT_32436 [Botryobasidium botryosum FD-172 SS1]